MSKVTITFWMRTMIVFMFCFQVQSQSQTGGGSDVSGGGDGLETKIIEGKYLAEEILNLSDVSDILHDAGFGDPICLQWNSLRGEILNELNGSRYRVYKQDPENSQRLIDEIGDSIPRSSFMLDGVEKTFITSHRPFALIKINFPRCVELNIDIPGFASLFIRDSSRHLGSADGEFLTTVEQIALRLARDVNRRSHGGAAQPLRQSAHFMPDMYLVPENNYYSHRYERYFNLYSFHISKMIRVGQYIDFLNQYQTRYPDRIAENGMIADEVGHSFLAPPFFKNMLHFQISYEKKNIPHYQRYGSGPESDPIAYITWFGAQEYCRSLGLELPSVFQLEKSFNSRVIPESGIEYLNYKYQHYEWTSTHYFEKEFIRSLSYENPQGPTYGTKYISMSYWDDPEVGISPPQVSLRLYDIAPEDANGRMFFRCVAP